MKGCLEICKQYKCSCPIKECKSWIDYKEEYNCMYEAIARNGAMTLREIAERMGVSFVRIKQIEDKALLKLSKRIKKKL